MTASISKLGNKLSRDASKEDLNEKKPEKLTKNSSKTKQKTDKQTIKQVEAIEKKVKSGGANSSQEENFGKRGRPKTIKKISSVAQKATTPRKWDSSSGGKVKSTGKRTYNGVRKDKSSRRVTRQIPLVLPNAKTGVGTSNSSLKYTLQRADSNQAHRQRVWSNRRKVKRRTRTRTSKRKEPKHEYLGDYWTEPKIKLDDLSSLECGSYSDKVEEIEFETNTPTSHPEEASKSSVIQQLICLNSSSDFIFNISAPEFVPKRRRKKKKSNIFTVRELVESLKGKSLPRMPNLKKLHPGMCGI